MKKNRTNILLIGIVIAIWGIVIYRIISGMKNVDSPINEIVSTGFGFENKNTTTKDTFSLHKNTRDPFLGKNPVVLLKSNQNKNNAIKPNIQKPVTEIPKPDIKYLGMIKNNSNEKQMALVRINGQQKRMNPGEEIENMKLLKIFKDSCLFSYGKEKLIVKK